MDMLMIITAGLIASVAVASVLLASSERQEIRIRIKDRTPRR